MQKTTKQTQFKNRLALAGIYNPSALFTLSIALFIVIITLLIIALHYTINLNCF